MAQGQSFPFKLTRKEENKENSGNDLFDFDKYMSNMSFSGADAVATMIVPVIGKQGNVEAQGDVITLGELQTISYSIHRENSPIRTLGHVNVRGFVKGGRTIAGSLIFTVFNEYAFYRIKQFREYLARKQGFFAPLADMLPPFDIVITFFNEYGIGAKMKIFGITIVDEGQTLSIDDLITEQTYTYMARGIQPLIKMPNDSLLPSDLSYTEEMKARDMNIGSNIFGDLIVEELALLNEEERKQYNSGAASKMTIRNINNSREFDPLHERLDAVWSGGTQEDLRFSNYYDYYFSGEDIRIYIDGLFSPEDELDIANFAFNVRQEKQPLYGFWSYNYDAMMYGTRIITGEITMFSKYPRRMTELLEKAADVRARAAKNKYPINEVMSNLRSSFETEEDEKLIEKYWARGQLDRTTDDPFFKNVQNSNRNIFSAHPPFNLIIVYGLEEVALSPLNVYQSEDTNISDNIDRMMISDVNQRTVKSDDFSQPMKIVIQEVNLTNMSIAYGPGGQPVGESYQFIARDHYFTEANLSFVKTKTTFNTSADPESARSAETATSTSGNMCAVILSVEA